MDYFAEHLGYDTKNPEYQKLIRNAEQQGLQQDGTKPSVENTSLVQTVQTMPKHDTAPPEPVFPDVSCRYSTSAKKAVFSFSKHSNDELRGISRQVPGRTLVARRRCRVQMEKG